MRAFAKGTRNVSPTRDADTCKARQEPTKKKKTAATKRNSKGLSWADVVERSPTGQQGNQETP